MLSPWFQALQSKTLDEVLNSLHMQVVLATSKISDPRAE